MRGIGGREAGVDRQALALQPGQRARQSALLDVAALQVDRTAREPLPGRTFVIGQAGQQRGIGMQAQRETDLAGVG